MLISKFYRVAQEGQTTDGREITRQEIEQMANNYTPTKYGARIWLEHLRGILPDSLFNALGDVKEAKSQDDDGLLGLYVKSAPTPEYVAMNEKNQKIYSSIEMDRNFAGTGEAYLVGLAATDSPASLGTEVMAFSSNAEVSLFAERKQRPENVFSSAIESVIEFEEQAKDEPEKPSLFSRVKDMLKKNEENSEDNFSDVHNSIELVAESQQEIIEQFNNLSQELATGQEEFKALQTSFNTLSNDFKTLSSNLEENTDANFTQRPPAAGGDGLVVTDC